MPQTRSIHLRRSQIIWLAVIVAVGVIVGALAGAWWGVGAALIMLALSEVIERMKRALNELSRYVDRSRGGNRAHRGRAAKDSAVPMKSPASTGSA